MKTGNSLFFAAALLLGVKKGQAAKKASPQSQLCSFKRIEEAELRS